MPENSQVLQHFRTPEHRRQGLHPPVNPSPDIFLPSVWKEIPDKQEFLNNLKFKAGMNPSYWSNKIKVYRFYTVEINQNAD